MRIAILAMGSRGDVQPLVGLARGLQRAGHDIRFATHPNFEQMILDAGLEFFLIPVNPAEVMESKAGREAMEQGGNTHVTGYWFLDAHEDWSPPRELAEFLAAGPPPIYVGFGSMSTRSSDRTTEVILEALSRTGQRGLLAKGWGGVSKAELRDNVFIIDAAPHDWLFPQVAAVVHHCGAGTTAAGLRAGVPTIPVPHFADQPFWAKRLFDLGVAPKGILHEELNADNLSEAINAVVHHPDITRRSSSLGEQIRSEDGIGNAVRLIDEYLERF